eukprot:4063101-Prymnesium_polylepis.1
MKCVERYGALGALCSNVGWYSLGLLGRKVVARCRLRNRADATRFGALGLWSEAVRLLQRVRESERRER